VHYCHNSPTLSLQEVASHLTEYSITMLNVYHRFFGVLTIFTDIFKKLLLYLNNIHSKARYAN